MNDTTTLNDYLLGLGLKIKVSQDYNDNAQGWAENTNHYRVTLSKENRRMSFWYYQGYGIKDAPTLDRVIENLASDRIYAQMDVQEFGDEFGWNKDTIKTHRLLVSLNARYEKLIGSTELLDEIYDKVSA
jgi:hypothetical protein